MITNFHSSNPIKDVKSLVDIEDVISYYTGSEFKHGFMLCPFHNEKTASFSINKHKQRFTCFGCGANDDAIGFVAQLYKVNNREASKIIDNDFNLGVYSNDTTTANSIKKYKRKQKEKKNIENWFDEIYIGLANWICDYNHLDFSQKTWQSENDYLKADYICDILLDGTFEEKLEVINFYGDFIRRIRKN